MLLFSGYVGSDFMELAFVFITTAVCLIAMVLFGAWWER